MGRLDDIIERNRNPRGSFKKPAKGAKPAPAVAPSSKEIAASNRLDEIIARNKHPGRARRQQRITFGLGSIVLLVVLLLLIFTNLAQSPDLPPEPGSASGSSEHRVRDIKLWTPPPKPAR